MKKKLILPILILIFALTTVTVGIFAWFIGGNTSVSNITFNTGVVDVDFSLYLVKDFNNDGIADLKEENIGTVDAPQFILKETIVDIKKQGIVIENAIPGMVYTYRLIAHNNGDKECYIAIRNNNLKDSILNKALSFNAKIKLIQEDNTELETEYKISLAGEEVLVADEQYSANSNLQSGKMPLITIPPNKGTSYQPLVFEFQIRFEHLNFLKNWTETSTLFQDKTDLNEYSNQKLFDNDKNTGSRFYFECRQGKNDL